MWVYTQPPRTPRVDVHSRGALGSKGPGTRTIRNPAKSAQEPSQGTRGTRSLTRTPCTGPTHAPEPPAPSLRPGRPHSSPVAGQHSAPLTWARGPPGPGPLCGRMAGRAGAQSKLNLHLGAPSGRSSRRGHRSPLMASSKCGAAASAPRVRAPPPSPRARCKMVFTKVNIGPGARPGHRESPLASPARAAAGLPRPRPRPRCPNCPRP